MTKENKKPGKHRIIKGILLGILGIFLYFVLGCILPYTIQPKVTEDTKKAFSKGSFTGNKNAGERAKVISRNEEALAERIRLISQAKERIILSTFEFHSDTSGKQVMAALMAAADRGVKVEILTDGFPCMTSMWNDAYFRALDETENITLNIYNPVRLFKPWTLMGRLHDKYLLVDDMAYIMGGRNTYDYFLGGQKGYKNYDWDVLVYCDEHAETSSMEPFLSYFDEIWNLKDVKPYNKEPFQACADEAKKAETELNTLYASMQEDKPDWFLPADIEKGTVPVNQVSLISNPTTVYAKEPVVYYQLTELMKTAENDVSFHTPYIICNDWMTNQLRDICDSVDTVQMMTNSVANNGNPFGAMDYLAHKGEILDTGVQILEYDGGVSYHGKCMVMDDNISAIGSFNWDMRSAYLDTEMMLIIDSPEFNQMLRAEMAVYEEKTLTVIDEDHSTVPEGMEAQVISGKRKRRVELLKAFGWARFLM